MILGQGVIDVPLEDRIVYRRFLELAIATWLSTADLQ
jgi:hypothetical protein